MNNKKKTIYIVVAFLLIILALIVLFLLNGSIVHTTKTVGSDKYEMLDCKSNRNDDAFFVSSIANTVSHELKITFKNDKLNKLNYSFNGIYRSNEVAKADETNLHAKYNLYMGENGVEQDSLTPDYSVNKSKFRISLFANDFRDINSTTAMFFFLKKEDLEEISSYSIDDLELYYEKINFDCEVIIPEKNDDIIK